MKIFLKILSIFFTISFASLGYSQDDKQINLSSIKVETNLHEKVLDNGLRIIVKVDNRSPTVAHTVWYKVGSIDEPSGKTGISHLLEHMMFKGTNKIAPGEFSKIVAAKGGWENAFTSRDNTTYFQLIPKSTLPLMMELEADRMINLKLHPEELVKEREVVKEERRLRIEDQPQSLFWERLSAYSYVNHPYRNPIIGWMQDIENITLDDLKKWYQKYYAPENANLVIVGDVDPEEVFNLAQKTYGKIPANVWEEDRNQEISEKKYQIISTRGKVSINFKAPTHLPTVAFIYHAPNLQSFDQDWHPYALEILAMILDGHSGARIPAELVKKKSIAVSAGVGYNMLARGPARFIIGGSPSDNHTSQQLADAISQEIKKIIEKGVNEQELLRAKRQIAAQSIFKLDSLYGLAREIGQLEILGLGYQNINKIIDNINNVSTEQVQLVAKKFLHDDNLVYGELIPTKDK